MNRQQARNAGQNRGQPRLAHTDRNRAYIEGNTVRKLAPVPRREQEEYREEQRKKRVDRATRANRQRALMMGPGYLLFLTIAVVTTVGVCALYVHLQSNISSRMKNIASLESRILDLRTDNDAALKRVETSVNLDDIKDKAMNVLGMVYPTQDQIIYFEINVDDFMNQYQDIPRQ